MHIFIQRKHCKEDNLIHPHTDNHCKHFDHINEIRTCFFKWICPEKIDFLTQTHADAQFEKSHWCFRRSFICTK